ncbi:MAG: DUF881 domain-containing protein [Actinomycetaceae bacterium]|nr:DUF881 domain-containing protein [Actinomycetaceae bacterium]
MTEPKPANQRRLRDILTVRFRPIHLVIALMMLALGFALVSQIKIQSSDPLDGVQEDELVLLLDQLTQAEEQMRDERSVLSDQLEKLQSEQSQEQAARESALRELRQAQILGGTVPVEGPGLIMTVTEGGTPISEGKFVTVLGELRNAGAEAIELNGNRVVASSYITRDESGMKVSGNPISSPYVWKIIGDADTIQPALEIAKGATSQLRASEATIDITRADLVTIDSVAPTQNYTWAEPVE